MILAIRSCCSKLISVHITAEQIMKRSCQTLTQPSTTTTPHDVEIATLKHDDPDIHQQLDNFLKQAYLEEKNTSLIKPDGGGPEDEVSPFLMPTFNFAAYVNKSKTLQKFIQLGVDLHKIERRKGLGQFFIKLDFERDCKDHLMFLNDIGVPADSFGWFITKNPLIFKEDIDNLQIRVNYLESKRFTRDMISRVVSANPYWLMFTTKRIDRRLGYFQKKFELTGNQMRSLVCRSPKLITYNLPTVEKNSFCIQEELGFEKEETKQLVLTLPKALMMNHDELFYRLDYVHNTMGISHVEIIRSPEVIQTRQFKLRQRHGFLSFLGRAQYDPKKELYVPLKDLVTATEKDFVENIAKSCMEDWDKFLKSQ